MKDTPNFREYNGASKEVVEHYRTLRTNQTLSYVRNMHNKYFKFTLKLGIWDALNLLDKFIDVSDPDITLPNIHHLFQTAEAIRRDGHPDWLQLTGLIHDLGKLIFIKGYDEDGTSIKQQWGIVGDTFIVGCKIPTTCVYPEFNEHNLDKLFEHSISDTGIYAEGIGLDKCYCSFGHDEYLYQVLKFNKCRLPDEAMYIIRYHSLYPWHTGGSYRNLMNDTDHQMLKWVKLFNKYDLYTKCEEKIDINKLKKYYTSIIQKYFVSDTLYW